MKLFCGCEDAFYLSKEVSCRKILILQFRQSGRWSQRQAKARLQPTDSTREPPPNSSVGARAYALACHFLLDCISHDFISRVGRKSSLEGVGGVDGAQGPVPTNRHIHKSNFLTKSAL